MANTRFNYDKCRTNKLLQEATGPGRYMLNTPGPAHSLVANNDPHYRLQRWGGNLGHVLNGHPIDIDSDLKGVTRKLTKYCQKKEFPNAGVPVTQKVDYPICGDALTDESRATHPAWQYRAIKQHREDPLFFNPQENVCMRFHNNLNTRLLERDNFVPKIPCLKEK